MLERIVSLQQQLLEHQEGQLLSETRGFFFAFLVSVAVIVAGVAPLVEADALDRLVIVVRTVAATAVAALAYTVRYRPGSNRGGRDVRVQLLAAALLCAADRAKTSVGAAGLAHG